MKRTLTLLTVIVLLMLAPAVCQAQNLLTNGNLNLLDEDGNPNAALYFNLPVGWTINTDPCSYSPCDPVIRYPAWAGDFAEHSTPGVAGTNGVLFNSTEGDFPGFPDVLFVDADLMQTVPGTPGQQYKMTGWAYFEGGYAGGVDTIDPLSPASRAGMPSLTDTFFALEFLDAGNNVLPGSILDYELKANGQVNNPNPVDSLPENRNWMQHTLIGTAPAGTVSVRVRASMVDGEFNIDLPHQAAWVDDFGLFAVPEPTSALLGLLGLAMVGAVRRTRK
jgi:hypothetical protein